MKKIFVYSMLLALLSAVPTEIEAKRYAKSSMRTKAKTERNVSKSNVKKQGNHDYVDLGLPSGTLWATKNIGASSPEGYGNYYAWGETSPKSSYTWSNYTGKDITSDELPAGRDAATANWGSAWQMPSTEQIKELVDGCKWTWTSRNGVNGQLGRSMYNNKTIFLPAAGYPSGASLNLAGSYGFYWSRTRLASCYAYYLYFNSGGVYPDYGYNGRRHYGLSVRAVRVSKKPTYNEAKTERNVSKSNVEKQGNDDYVDLGLPSGTLWATKNIGASSPEGYGNYYAWGETSPKSSYTWDNYTGEDITSDELTAGRDAATANWGSDWRMPSIEQIKELVDGCKWTWTSRNGVNGQLGRSMYNNKTIFLPAAGCRDGASDAGSDGNYWSRTRYGSYDAYYLYFFSGGVDYYYFYGRCYGRSVRAVRVSKN